MNRNDAFAVTRLRFNVNLFKLIFYVNTHILYVYIVKYVLL